MKQLPGGCLKTFRELERWQESLPREAMTAFVANLARILTAALGALPEVGGSSPSGRYLRTGEAAERAGVGRDAIRALAEDGLLAGARQVGRRGEWRIPEAALIRFLEAGGADDADDADNGLRVIPGTRTVASR